MPESGQLVPDQAVESLDGAPHRLWDYRQKSHVALLRGLAGDSLGIKNWNNESAVRKNRLNWLNVTPLVAMENHPGDARIVEIIDQYGRLWKALPVGSKTVSEAFDEIEAEYLYYEAQHCCESAD